VCTILVLTSPRAAQTANGVTIVRTPGLTPSAVPPLRGCDPVGSPCILILSKFFYSLADAQVNCLKNNIKIYIKINIKTPMYLNWLF
jgi:hypothetical protein